MKVLTEYQQAKVYKEESKKMELTLDKADKRYHNALLEAQLTADRDEGVNLLDWIVEHCDEIHDPKSSELIYYAIKPEEIELLKKEAKQ